MPYLSMPVNINQNHDPIENTRQYGCAVSCATDVASYHGQKYYTLANMLSAGVYTNSNATCVWYIVPDATFTNYTALTQAMYLSKIKTEIDAGSPVLVNMVGTYNHWVVAYGYTGTGDDYSKIKVLDPYNSTGFGVYSSITTGRDITLDAAFNTQGASSISSLKTTAKK